MTEYTPRQYADAAMFLLSDVELSNADRGTLARMMRAAIAAGFDPSVTDTGGEVVSIHSREQRTVRRYVPPTR